MIITLHVIPKASKNEVVGWVDAGGGKRALKVKIQAPPEDGKANAALLKFLAESWHIPKRQLALVSGETSRRKMLKILDENAYTQLMGQLS